MKKLLVLVLAVLMVAGVFAACQTNDMAEDVAGDTDVATEDVANNTGDANDEILIVHACTNLATEHGTNQDNAMKAYCEELGLDYRTVDAGNDAQKQVEQLESLIAEGEADAIISGPVDSAMELETYRAVVEAGIPVIILGTALEGIGASNVLSPDFVAGEMEMQKLCDMLGGEGNVALLLGPLGSSYQLERSAGYQKVLDANPGLKVVFEEPANWSREEAMVLMENWLQTGTEIDAVCAHNDEMAVGAMNVLIDAGLDDVLVCGIDGIEDAKLAIQAGNMDFSLLQDAVAQGKSAIDIAVDMINGGEPQTSSIPFTLLTQENIEEYLK